MNLSDLSGKRGTEKGNLGNLLGCPNFEAVQSSAPELQTEHDEKSANIAGFYEGDK